jgi:Tfp pilus assembly protein PilV
VRAEDGLGLVELLIALLVLNVGIFATIGAFTSAAATIRRASHTSTAAAIADQEMEQLHNKPYTGPGSIANTTINPWPNAPDGRSYTVNVSVNAATGAAYASSRSAVELVTVTVTDNADGKVLVTSPATFTYCTQANLGSSPVSPTTACQT